MTFREWLVKKRADLGMSQEDLSVGSGVRLGALRLIEQGVTVDPRLSTVLALVKALGGSVRDLDGIEGESPGNTRPAPAKKAETPKRGRKKPNG